MQCAYKSGIYQSKPNTYISLLCTACMMGWKCLLQNIKLVLPKKFQLDLSLMQSYKKEVANFYIKTKYMSVEAGLLELDESQYSLKCCSFLQDPILTQVLLIREYALACLCSCAAHYQYAVPCLCSCAAHSLFWGGMEGLVWLGAFNNYVDKMRGERVKKCLFLSTLRV